MNCHTNCLYRYDIEYCIQCQEWQKQVRNIEVQAKSAVATANARIWLAENKTLEADWHLNDVKSEFQYVKEKLKSTTAKLNESKQELVNAKEKLSESKAELSTVNQQIDESKAELSSVSYQIDESKQQLETTCQEIDCAKQQLKDIQTKILSLSGIVKIGHQTNVLLSDITEYHAQMSEYMKSMLTYVQQNVT